MRTDGKTTRPFRLVGRIAAARLPFGVIVPGMIIRRDPQAHRLARPKDLLATSGGAGGGLISAAPSEISIESDALVEVRVRAVDEADAAQRAQQKFLRPLTAALMLATGQPAHVELARVAPEGDDGEVVDQGWSVWSDIAMMTDLGAMPAMAPEETSTLARTLKTFHHDHVAGLAAADLVEGAKMQWTHGGRPSEVEASVLRRFLVIERIASRVAAGREQDPREQEQRDRIVADLARDLRKGAPEQSARRIKNAARALEEFEAQRLTRDIPYAAEVLGLPASVGVDARNLNKLRNQSLAHPGRHRTHDQLAQSAVLAARTAEAFLDAYATWCANGRPRSGHSAPPAP